MLNEIIDYDVLFNFLNEDAGRDEVEEPVGQDFVDQAINEYIPVAERRGTRGPDLKPRKQRAVGQNLKENTPYKRQQKYKNKKRLQAQADKLNELLSQVSSSQQSSAQDQRNMVLQYCPTLADNLVKLREVAIESNALTKKMAANMESAATAVAHEHLQRELKSKKKRTNLAKTMANASTALSTSLRKVIQHGATNVFPSIKDAIIKEFYAKLSDDTFSPEKVMRMLDFHGNSITQIETIAKLEVERFGSRKQGKYTTSTPIIIKISTFCCLILCRQVLYPASIRSSDYITGMKQFLIISSIAPSCMKVVDLVSKSSKLSSHGCIEIFPSIRQSFS